MYKRIWCALMAAVIIMTSNDITVYAKEMQKPVEVTGISENTELEIEMSETISPTPSDLPEIKEEVPEYTASPTPEVIEESPSATPENTEEEPVATPTWLEGEPTESPGDVVEEPTILPESTPSVSPVETEEPTSSASPEVSASPTPVETITPTPAMTESPTPIASISPMPTASASPSAEVGKTELKEEEVFVCEGGHEISQELMGNMQLLNQALYGRSSSVSPDNASAGLFQENGLMPSTGNVKTLVVMVDFADTTFSEEFTKDYVTKIMLGEENINDASYPTESLKAWYERSSYGKLNITGEVITITLEQNKSYYEESSDNPDGKTLFFNEVWEKVGKLELDWSAYDSNNDMYVDAPCLMVAGNSDAWASQWWSHSSSSSYEMSCGYKPGRYVMCMENQVSLDPSTAIHEFGHMLGLPDLYSVENSSWQIHKGIATWDMMSTNMGDFNGLCKMLLGWIDAEDIKTISGTDELQQITLQPYEKTGELAVLYTEPKEASLFGEYFLIQFLDPTSKNDADAECFAQKSLRIYHVNAELDANNSFKYANNGDDLWLIRYVDKDINEIHGEKSWIKSVYDGTNWGNVTRTVNYYGPQYEGTICEYVTGDEFTPYTVPSTAAYPFSDNWLEPYKYTGLSVKDIIINDTCATFNAFYEEEAQEIPLIIRQATAGKIAVQNANMMLVSSREIWENDTEVVPFLQKKGETEKCADISLDLTTTFDVNDLEMREQFFMFTAFVDADAVLEADTDYEMVFPAGMFIDSLGRISDEIIVELQTEKGYWKDTINVYEFDNEKYHSVSNTCALTSEGNIAVVCESVKGEVYLCIINPQTQELIRETPIVYNGSTITGELRRDSYYNAAITNVEDFGVTAAGTYWMTYRDPWKNINDRTVKLYIFGNDGSVKKRFEPEIVTSFFIGNRYVVMPLDGKCTSVYYDIDEQKEYVGDEFTLYSQSFVLNDNQIFTGGNYITPGGTKNTYGIYKFENDVINREQIVYFQQMTPGLVEKVGSGYRMLAHKNGKIWSIELDENFIIKNETWICDSKALHKAEKIVGGYLLEIRENNYSWLSDGKIILLDDNFNKISELSGIGKYEDNVRLIGQSGEYNYFVDYNATNTDENKTKFSYRISDSIVIETKEREIATEDIILSDNIQLDDDSKVIINSNSFDVDIEEFLAGIESVNGETYELFPLDEELNNEEYYFVVTNVEGTYKQYYQTVIKGATFLETTKYLNDLEFDILMKNGKNGVRFCVDITNNGVATTETIYTRIKLKNENGEIKNDFFVEIPAMQTDEIISKEWGLSSGQKFEPANCEVVKVNIKDIDAVKNCENLQFSKFRIEEQESSAVITFEVKNNGESVTEPLYLKLQMKDDEGTILDTVKFSIDAIGEYDETTKTVYVYSDVFETIADYEIITNEDISLIATSQYLGDFLFSNLQIEKKSSYTSITIDVMNCGEVTTESQGWNLYLLDADENIIGVSALWSSGYAAGELKQCGGDIIGISDGAVSYVVREQGEKYVVTLDNQEATIVGTESVNVSYDESMPSIEIPQKDGYVFRGYFSEKGGSGTQYYNIYGVGIVKYGLIENITLYAYWEEKVEPTATPTATPTAEPTATPTATPTAEPTATPTTTPTATPITYTVTFDSQGGSDVMAVADVAAGSTIQLPEVPAKEGFIFAGWFTELKGQGEEFTSDFVITENITVYANWTAIPTMPVPVANIASGSEVTEGTELVLTNPVNGALIYYTVNGEMPTEESILYSAPIVLTENMTIQAIAVKEGYANSEVAVFVYEVITKEKGNGDVLPEDVPSDGIIPEGIWVAGITDVTYTGNAEKHSFRVYDGKVLLTEKTDYSISYKNNKSAYVYTDEDYKAFTENLKNTGKSLEIGTFNPKKAPQVAIKMKGNYSGSQTVYFRINPMDITGDVFTTDNLAATYSGKKQTPKPVLTWNGKALKYGTDFYVPEYDSAKDDKAAFTNSETYNLTIVGKQNFTGEIPITLTISNSNKQIAMDKVSVKGIKSMPWTGEQIIQTGLKISYKDDTLSEESGDYTVRWGTNQDVGTGTLTLIGTGEDTDGDGYSYIGTKTVSFKITGTAMSKVTIIGINKSYTYTGDEIIPVGTLSYKANTKAEPIGLVEGIHYTSEYQKNIEKGTATIIYTGLASGGYTGTKKVSFKIDASSIADKQDGEETIEQIEVAYKDVEKVQAGIYVAPYMKGGAMPEVIVTSGDNTLEFGKDYTISYANNKKVALSTAKSAPTITIKGKGNYTGSKKVYFTIASKPLTNENGITVVAKDKAESAKKNGYRQGFKVYDADGKALGSSDYDTKNVTYTLLYTEQEDGSIKVVNEELDKNAVVPANSMIQITVRGKGIYEGGEAVGTYQILESGYDISKATIQISDQPYTGNPIYITEQSQFKSGKIYIKIGKETKELVFGEDFIVVPGSYVKNINKGTAKVTFQGINDFGGTKTVSFKISARVSSTFWKGIYNKTALLLEKTL